MPETEVIVCSRPKTARSRPKSTASNLLDHLPPPKPNTAYKRYTPISPCCSKVLSYRWEQEKLQKHKEKIKTMKACIDNQSASRIDPKLKSLKQQVYKKGMLLIDQ